jgi:hypothetical protein
LQPAGRKYPDKNKYPINHIGQAWPVCNNLETLFQLGSGLLAILYEIFWALRDSCASELQTVTAVDYLGKGYEVNQLCLFYYVSTGSEHDIFPFQTEWFKYTEEISFKKRLDICLL